MENTNMLLAEKINSDKFVTPDANMPIYSDKLFTNGDVVLVHHQGKQYSLRRTRNGKLILTK